MRLLVLCSMLYTYIARGLSDSALNATNAGRMLPPGFHKVAEVDPNANSFTDGGSKLPVPRRWEDGVTLHIPLVTNHDTLLQIDYFQNTVLNARHCFKEILVTLEGPKGNHTLRRDLFADGPKGIAPKVVCAVNLTVHRIARMLEHERKCPHPVRTRVLLGSDLRSGMTEKVLVNVFNVPEEYIDRASIVMWKNSLNYMSGIFGFARTRYVLHLDADLRFVDPYKHSFVDTAVQIMNTTTDVVGVMVPFCNDSRTGAMREFTTVQVPNFPSGHVFRQPDARAKHGSNHIQKWYFEKNDSPCGVSAKQEAAVVYIKGLPPGKNCFDVNKPPAAHAINSRMIPKSGSSCSPTASMFSSQVFLIDAARFWAHLLPLRVPGLQWGWRSQIECLVEGTLRAARGGSWDGKSDPIFVRLHGRTAGTCKTGLFLHPICSGRTVKQGLVLGRNCTTHKWALDKTLERQMLTPAYGTCMAQGEYHRILNESKAASGDWW